MRVETLTPKVFGSGAFGRCPVHGAAALMMGLVPFSEEMGASWLPLSLPPLCEDTVRGQPPAHQEESLAP